MHIVVINTGIAFYFTISNLQHHRKFREGKSKDSGSDGLNTSSDTAEGKC